MLIPYYITDLDSPRTVTLIWSTIDVISFTDGDGIDKNQIGKKLEKWGYLEEYTPYQQNKNTVLYLCSIFLQMLSNDPKVDPYYRSNGGYSKLFNENSHSNC